MKDTRFFYTGVRATENQERDMFNPLPVIVIGGSVTESQAEVMHRCALFQGLPDIVGHYSYDLSEHEFIRWPEVSDQEPDTFPSRRLSDIVGKK